MKEKFCLICNKENPKDKTRNVTCCKSCTNKYRDIRDRIYYRIYSKYKTIRDRKTCIVCLRPCKKLVCNNNCGVIYLRIEKRVWSCPKSQPTHKINLNLSRKVKNGRK